MNSNFTLNYPSIEKLVKDYPNKITRLKKKINIPISSNLNTEINPLIHICNEIVGHFKNIDYKERYSDKFEFIFEESHNNPEDLINDIFEFRGVRGKLKKNAKGNYVWDDYGPEGDVEWAYFINRHYILPELLEEYKKMQEEKYLLYIAQFIEDWIIHNPPPKILYVKSPQWRVLEPGLRLIMSWITIFYECVSINLFPRGTLILLLSSIYDHMSYLRRWPARHGNHLIMEMDALATASIAFSEFKQSKKWFHYAKKVMLRQLMKKQVYPDGVQNEMTSHYHQVSLHHFEHIYFLCKNNRIPIKDAYYKKLESMWEYLLYSMRPNGTPPLNNDSYLYDNRKLFIEKSKMFNRPDWLYIATNGSEGNPPIIKFFNFYQWAGQIIMRNGWGSESNWGFFDIGPWGMAHQHRDKLHVSINVKGRDILVDSGTYRYKRDRWRDRYFQASRGHNTLLIDGKGQKPTRHKLRRKPNIDVYSSNESYMIKGKFQKGYAVEKIGVKGQYHNSIRDKISHSRTLIFVKHKFWVIIDELRSKKPHKVTALWHFHPDCTLKKSISDNPHAYYTFDKNKGNLLLYPIEIDKLSLSSRIVKGKDTYHKDDGSNARDSDGSLDIGDIDANGVGASTNNIDEIQGWYSPVYNHKDPSPCVVYDYVEGDGDLKKKSYFKRFVWLIIPFANKVPSFNASLDHEFKDEYLYISVNLTKYCDLDYSDYSQCYKLKIPSSKGNRFEVKQNVIFCDKEKND